KLNSANSIAKTMKSLGQSVSTRVILEYLGYFGEAYLLYDAPRFDIRGKKVFESNDKVYFEDIGIRNFIAGGNREQDIEKVLENVVYNQLINDGFKVQVGQLRVGEVDFVCTKTGKTAYVQVSYIIADEETKKREFGRLESINDNYPKYVISLTPLVKRNDMNGITHLGLREFLMYGL
ncbi:MAG TPA: ATPase, partial [Rikenellaceae bacterium]|nr:ATPase [Rikenellaceae bacterium]